MMTLISRFQLGRRTETYTFVKHIGTVSCNPTQDERRIPLSAGETFPPRKSCRTGVILSD
jgi:hypothetical protein